MINVIKSVVYKVIGVLIKPGTSRIGAVFFCFLWFTLGSINDFLIKPDFSNIPDGRTYLPWARDYLGHYLTVLTLLASTTFWFYYQFISNMLRRKKELNDRALEAVKWWFFPALVVCIGLVINNVYYITYASEKIEHWSHVLLPLWTPLIISSFYYLGVVFPLLLSIVSYSVLLNHCAQNCTKIMDFSHNDKDYLFGIGKFGDAIMVSLILLVLFLVPPLIIQVWQKGAPTFGSIISIPIALIIFFNIFIRPLKDTAINLSYERKKLIKIKQNKIDEQNNKLKYKKDKDDIDISLRLIEKEENELDLIKAQKIVPVSRKISIISILTITPAIFLEALKWVKSVIRILSN